MLSSSRRLCSATGSRNVPNPFYAVFIFIYFPSAVFTIHFFLIAIGAKEHEKSGVARDILGNARVPKDAVF